MGLYSGFRTRNKFKVLPNIQANRNRIISAKRFCLRKPKVKKD